VSRCRETAGILFKHRCNAPIIGNCVQCQKPVCATHGKPHGYGVICVSCLRNEVADPYKRGSYAYLRDDPYFFWYYREDSWFSDPYGAEDYALFDAAESDFGADVGDDWAGS
jgi:hypothetical protein